MACDNNGNNQQCNNQNGYDQNGFNQNGNGCNQNGYGQNGGNANGFNQGNCYQNGYYQNGYCQNGYCQNGYGQYGYQGYNQGPYQNGYNNYYQHSDKSKVVAGILAILIGTFGVQYFYLGKIMAGFLSILLTLVTCGTIWPILTFAQGIYMLTLTDQEFDAKYVYTNSSFPLF